MRRMRSARRVMSSKLPMGVLTRYRPGASSSSPAAAAEAAVSEVAASMPPTLSVGLEALLAACSNLLHC